MSETQPEQNLPAEAAAPESQPVFARRAGMWSSGAGDTSGYGGLRRDLAMPGRSEGPFGEPHDSVLGRALEVIPALRDARVLFDRDELTIYVPREQLTDVARQFRDDAFLRFEVCVSVSGVHYPQETGSELHVVYHLLSYTHNRRVRLEVTCPEEDPHVPSVVATYPMVDYHERETWDMFGVIFDGHPSLTRILMPDDWKGHPQRKDYPLGGVDVEYKGAKVPAPDNRRSYS
ncbi:NADH-quinone oxidoreductase subunit C [Tessaracoccus lapidicaptus]|uniref:NADH-quinone oxidoreductase subunit C n=1 Tax=Tessaracoccus lapidicaptus TaxID=1427523 RepID=A0A1C0AHD5_9ACTN|nr:MULTISPECIES: NADH-quinone oxidoreductase subunit C [Tessaracoccus]AQX16509.1 NADH-quinone oxidoreductase subunit C [Tessaracoccus sp. T2.5-30]OCL31391.1 NADH-quinone oxidoreductase subunit C [Tessaracoccus lapidicaptus]VEP41173.1 NADH-quinone oxidoreductase subunit C [Tessaracoccus lapidicaptus]